MDILENKKIIIVDDDFGIRRLLETILNKNKAITKSFETGYDALQELKKSENEYDLILLDVNMHGISGFETASAILKENQYGYIPIIFITGNSNSEDKKIGFELGCVDYITKPFDTNEVLMRVKLHLELSYRRKEAVEYSNNLEKKVEERTFEINQTRKALINSLSTLAETRDNETGAHILRTQDFCKIIAVELSKLDKYKNIINHKFIELIYDCAPLHDIGKVGIPDNILLKPGKLTGEEFNIMKKHCYIGKKTLDSSSVLLKDTSFLDFASDIAYSHHEKWDGSGYPRKISGEDIPLNGRIMAISDVYDALTSKRVYKEAWTHQATKDLILDQKGKHFDPEIVDSFLKTEKEFVAVREQYSNEEK